MHENLKSSNKARNLFQKIEMESDFYASNSLKTQLEEKSKVLKNAEIKLSEICSKSPESKLISYIDEIGERYREFNRFATELNEPFLLFVMGMGKMGKSTLINALIGEKLAEEDALPSTWKIDMYKGDALGSNTVEILYKNRKSNILTKDQAVEYIKNEEKKTEESKQKIKEEFRLKKKEYVGNLEALEELQQELKRELSRITSDITEVRWAVPANNLLKNFTLVDTPGLKQELFGGVTENATDYYYKSDGALWIIDANKLSSKEQLELIDGTNGNFKDKHNKVIGVINRIDNVRKTGGQEAVDRVLEEAKRIYGDKFKTIVPISAKEAITGILQNNSKLIERSGISGLNKEIDNCFLSKAKQIKFKSKREGIQAISKDLIIKLNVIQEEFIEKENKRRELKKNLEKDLKDKKEIYIKSIEEVFNTYKLDVKNNIEYYTEGLFDIESESQREKFVKDKIFNVDDLISKLEIESKKNNESINRFKTYHMENSKITKYKYIQEDNLNSDLLGDRTENAVNGWCDSNFQTNDLNIVSGIGISILGAAILGPIGLILGGIANSLGLTKWIAIKLRAPSVKGKLKESLEASTNDLKEKSIKNIEEELEIIYRNASQSRESSFEKIYCSSKVVDSVLVCINEVISILQKPIKNISVKEILTGKH